MSGPTRPDVLHTERAASGGLINTINGLPQEQVDAIIRSKRKAREPKACYPCHTRKVKCDSKHPCDVCIKRDHADQCTYQRPSKKRQTIPLVQTTQKNGNKPTPAASEAGSALGATTAPGGEKKMVLVSEQEWNRLNDSLKAIQDICSSVQVDAHRTLPRQQHTPPPAPVTDDDASEAPFTPNSSAPENHGIFVDNLTFNTTVYMGPRSTLAHLQGYADLPEGISRILMDGDVLAKLGLINTSAAYPFVDLRGRREKKCIDLDLVCNALPEDDLCRRYVDLYCDNTTALYPVIYDVQGFKEEVEALLEIRRTWPHESPTCNAMERRPWRTDLDTLALIYAAIAVGSLAADQPIKPPEEKEKGMFSRIFVCCSYQLLRAKNCLAEPTTKVIQAMLLIGSVLSYNMNPGLSYAFIGLTTRLAEATGLHVDTPRYPDHERFTRRWVWWAMACQDNNFCLSFDRMSTLPFRRPPIPYAPDSRPGNRRYFETMCEVLSIGLDLVKVYMNHENMHMSYSVIQEYRTSLQRILQNAMPYLRDKSLCKVPYEHLQRLSVKLHVSFMCSDLCQSAFHAGHGFNEEETKSLRQQCIDDLTHTVEAYTELHGVSPYASVSWITISRAVGSAFCLIAALEKNMDRYRRDLLRELEAILAQKISDGYGVWQVDLPTSSSLSPLNGASDLDSSTVNDISPSSEQAEFMRDLARRDLSIRAPMPDISTPLVAAHDSLHELNKALASQYEDLYGANHEAPLYRPRLDMSRPWVQAQNSGRPPVSSYPRPASMTDNNSTRVSPPMSSDRYPPAHSNQVSSIPGTPESSGSSDTAAANLLRKSRFPYLNDFETIVGLL